jgi:hypothetical protein
MTRPSLRGFTANFRTYDAPLATKLRLSVANTWKKVKTHSGCCGNAGQARLLTARRPAP